MHREIEFRVTLADRSQPNEDRQSTGQNPTVLTKIAHRKRQAFQRVRNTPEGSEGLCYLAGT